MTPRPDRPPTPSARPHRSRTAGPRGAFTLIELLIVVTIISILLGLSIGVTLSFVTSAREAATRTTLAKIDVELGRRLAALRREQDRMGVSNPLVLKGQAMEAFPGYVAATAGPDGTLGTADDVLLTEVHDVLGNVPFPGVVTARPDRQYGRAGQSNLLPRGVFAANGYAEDRTASAEALFLLLSAGSTFGTSDPGGDLLTESELADTDNDGLREVVDGFGNPLRFYRTPTRLLRPFVPPAAGYDGTAPLNTPGPQSGNGRYPLASFENAAAAEFATAAQILFENALPGVEPNPADLFDSATGVHSDADPADPFLPTLGSVLRADPEGPVRPGGDRLRRHAGGQRRELRGARPGVRAAVPHADDLVPADRGLRGGGRGAGAVRAAGPGPVRAPRPAARAGRRLRQHHEPARGLLKR